MTLCSNPLSTTFVFVLMKSFHPNVGVFTLFTLFTQFIVCLLFFKINELQSKMFLEQQMLTICREQISLKTNKHCKS